MDEISKLQKENQELKENLISNISLRKEFEDYKRNVDKITKTALSHMIYCLKDSSNSEEMKKIIRRYYSRFLISVSNKYCGKIYEILGFINDKSLTLKHASQDQINKMIIKEAYSNLIETLQESSTIYDINFTLKQLSYKNVCYISKFD